MKKALIVLPTYNEEGNIEKVIKKNLCPTRKN
jgi:glycosyltransferase involved in cell wall biosynthesis